MTTDKQRAYQRQYYLQNKDKICARSKAWREDNREASQRISREWHARNPYHTRHGLTVGQFETLLATQGGHCATCSSTEPGGVGSWHVDHNHDCCPGRYSCGTCINGLLCVICNTAPDDITTLEALLAYRIKARAALEDRSDAVNLDMTETEVI